MIYGTIGGLGKSISFFLIPLYTRVFSVEDYGYLDLITAIVLLVGMIGTLQMESAIGRFFYEREQLQKIKISTAFWIVIIATSLLTLPLIIFAGFISKQIFSSDDLTNIIIIGVARLPFSNAFSYFMALMRYIKKPVKYGTYHLFQILLTTGLSIWFVVGLDYGLTGAFLGQLIGFSISTLLVAFYFVKIGLLGFVFSSAIKSQFLKYSLPLVPGVIIGWANLYINRFIMLYYLSAYDIGLVGVATRVAAIFALIEYAIKMTWGPFLYENIKYPDHRLTFNKVFISMSTVLLCLVAALSLFTEDLFNLLVPVEYQEAYKIALILFLAMGLNALMQIVQVGPAITKKTKYNSILSALGVISNIICLFAMVPSIGLIGVPLSFLTSIVVQFISSWLISEKLYYIGYKMRYLSVLFLMAATFISIAYFLDVHFIFKMVLVSGLFITCFLVLKTKPLFPNSKSWL